MKTIEIYEKTETKELQELLKKYESLLEENELIKDNTRNEFQNYEELKRISYDYEIDISLIRTELNRRLWKNEF